MLHRFIGKNFPLFHFQILMFPLMWSTTLTGFRSDAGNSCSHSSFLFCDTFLKYKSSKIYLNRIIDGENLPNSNR